MTKKAVWTLPLNVHPAKSVDWCIPVPDDPYYRAAFWGALLNLASAYNWQDDPDHTAKEVALVWRDIIDGLERCLDEPTIKVIQEWSEEMCLRCNIRFHDGVLQVLDCGQWVDVDGQSDGLVPGGAVQPGSGSRPAIGQSTCYEVLLNANNQWQLPFAVNDGDTVTISNIDGAWSDGTALWTCPDGTPFVLGQCFGARGHATGDPDGTLYHMQLLAKVGSVYYSGTDGAFTIPGGTGTQNLILQANDADLGDNRGSIRLKICVENGGTPPIENWCYTFNFTLSDYGWIGVADTEWAAGEGWHGGSPTFDRDFVGYTFPSVINLTRLVMEFDAGIPQALVWICLDDITLSCSSTPATLGATVIDQDYGSGVSVSSISLGTEDAASDDFWGNLIRVTMYGTGDNPFGPSNC